MIKNQSSKCSQLFYLQHKCFQKRQFLSTLMLRLPASSFSPISNEWVTTPCYLNEVSCLLRNIFHKWRVRLRFFNSIPQWIYTMFNYSVTNIVECMIKCLEIECERSLLQAFYSKIERHLIHWGNSNAIKIINLYIRKEWKKRQNFFIFCFSCP